MSEFVSDNIIVKVSITDIYDTVRMPIRSTTFNYV